MSVGSSPAKYGGSSARIRSRSGGEGVERLLVLVEPLEAQGKATCLLSEALSHAIRGGFSVWGCFVICPRSAPDRTVRVSQSDRGVVSERGRPLGLTTQEWPEAGHGSAPVPGGEDLLGVVLATVDGILVVGAGGRVRFANPAAGVVLGRTAEELVELPFGLPLPRPDHLAELDVVRQDGRRAVVEMHVAGSRWRGERVQVVTLRDVTDRVGAERLLRRSEERYALSARAANDGLWDWELAAGRVHLSARCGEIIGLEAVDREEDIDWCWALVHPDDVGGFGPRSTTS